VSRRPQTPLQFKALALVLGLGLAALCVEIGLRLHFHRLPSLAALDGSGLELPPSDPSLPACANTLEWASTPRVRTLPGALPPLRVWFAGDSTTAAVGVRDEESWWLLLSQALGGGRAVEASNLAVPGADTCAILQQLNRRKAQAPPPDLVLVGVFADDLNAHLLLSVQARPVLLPQAAPPWLRPLVMRSYAANYLWLGIEPRRESIRERGLDPRALTEFRAATGQMVEWSAEVGARLYFVLMAPSGLRDCPERPRPDHECLRLAQDLDRMAEVLHQDGRAVLDLRPWFRETAVPLLPNDLALVAEGRLEIPLHVAAEGQAPLASEVLRLIREQPGPAGQDSPR